MTTQAQRDQELANRAKEHGARYSLRIVRECRRSDVEISLGFALIEQETNFRNVYGHDNVRNPVKSPPGGSLVVTRANWQVYLRHRKAGLGMQGAGPPQLTWWEYQDRADAYGGCWIPANSIRVGMEVLASNIKQHGEFHGVARYNGDGPAAQQYARSVLARQKKWHEWLT